MTRIRIRRASARGRTERDWLSSAHSFSFGHYYDPCQTGHGLLLAINEHHLRPGAGFAPRAHRAVDLLTYVMEGSLRYRDAHQISCTLNAGMLQLVQAGTGLTLSEMNACRRTPLRLLQIWLAATSVSQTPSYASYIPQDSAAREGLIPVAGTGLADPLRLSSDTRVGLARPGVDSSLQIALMADRQYYLQVTRGSLQLELADMPLQAGDGMHLCRTQQPLKLTAQQNSELLLIDLPADRLP